MQCNQTYEKKHIKNYGEYIRPYWLLQPVVVKLKILFQRICKSTSNWDDVINDCLILDWNNIVKSINNMEEFRINRSCFAWSINDPVISCELHEFSDASGGLRCVHVKSVRASGQVEVQLVTSKSPVVPLQRKYTIPRLELLGNFILSSLITVKQAIEDELKIKDYFCWTSDVTDSQISLAWINSLEKELKTFCQNRVKNPSEHRH